MNRLAFIAYEIDGWTAYNPRWTGDEPRKPTDYEQTVLDALMADPVGATNGSLLAKRMKPGSGHPDAIAVGGALARLYRLGLVETSWATGGSWYRPCQKPDSRHDSVV